MGGSTASHGDFSPLPGTPRTAGQARPDRTEHLVARLPGEENVWRTAQLYDAGINAAAIRELVTAGQLLRTRHGCYIRETFWERVTDREKQRVLILAHSHGTLTRKPDAVYSHVSAARLHRLWLWHADSFIHLTHATKMSTSKRASDVRHHVASLLPADVTEVDGVRVTTLQRTVLDCGLTMSYKQALIIVDHALRLGVSREALERQTATLAGHRGIRVFRRALAFADPRSESAGETLTRDLLRVAGIEAPVLQLAIDTRQGRFRADFAWPQYKVVLEFDGRAKYFDYRPTDQVLLAERKRENALKETGWTVIRIDWPDLFNEHLFRTRILTALRAGGAR
ncbi:type IV toxin-antitoxin system AbiEi family antitoxin domain-containing protein [Specibacter cremeus]|uniref:type IV toxin-antitoxin system AbiEi family antitoxin domain-containing protein n=1 Tax=Specibacter cremeus TaxID=1629051 RepID=UPI000F76F408|nr:type IV toxin-antitoxin system AbiEi family antitoxin domain-containing protein [Specibacter cremeus]